MWSRESTNTADFTVHRPPCRSLAYALSSSIIANLIRIASIANTQHFNKWRNKKVKIRKWRFILMLNYWNLFKFITIRRCLCSESSSSSALIRVIWFLWILQNYSPCIWSASRHAPLCDAENLAKCDTWHALMDVKFNETMSHLGGMGCCAGWKKKFHFN